VRQSITAPEHYWVNWLTYFHFLKQMDQSRSNVASMMRLPIEFNIFVSCGGHPNKP
jgi:hypothetical protein